MIEIILVVVLIAVLIGSLGLNALLAKKFRDASLSMDEKIAEIAATQDQPKIVAAIEPQEGEEEEDEEQELTFGKRINCRSATDGPLQGKSVLIADDTEENIEVLVAMLEQMGLTDYFLASNGKQAVSISSTTDFDVIYMDIQMPIMNGLDAAENIKSIPRHRDTPIIPITAHSRVVTKELCNQSGMFGFLQKPIDMLKLKEATEKAVTAYETVS